MKQISSSGIGAPSCPTSDARRLASEIPSAASVLGDSETRRQTEFGLQISLTNCGPSGKPPNSSSVSPQDIQNTIVASENPAASKPRTALDHDLPPPIQASCWV